MDDETSRWENKEGVRFLRKIGIRPGQFVLDFGARFGNYTIPLAMTVGRDGKVYALDKEGSSLEELTKKMAERKLDNIVPIKTNGSLKIRLGDGTMDAVLAYDVLHLIAKREKLYLEIRRVLRRDGLFSVYPKHSKFDVPNRRFKDLMPDEIKLEIENNGFHFEGDYRGSLSHEGNIINGHVFNFRRASRITKSK